MLNPFPVQFLSLFAYFLLRLFVGGILLYLGCKHFKYRRELKDVLVLSWFPYGRFTSSAFVFGEFILGILIVAGVFTQYVALCIMLMCIKMMVMRGWFAHHSLPPKSFYVLLFGSALTLFITGAGALAFDLPI